MKKWIKMGALTLALALGMSLMAGSGGTEAKKFVVLDEDLGKEQFGIGFRNEDIALGLEVQKQIDAMIADGSAAEISKKWFGEDVMLKDADYLEEKEAKAGDDSLEKVKQKGKLVVGLDDTFPPMGFRDEENNLVGFDIDLATEVAKRMGVEIEFQPIDWDSKELELNGGKIDCIWNGMSIDEDRLAGMFIPKPYLNNSQIIIVPEGSDIKTVADLAGKKIGLQKGSTSLNALQKNEVYTSGKVTDADITQLPENVSVFMELKAGRIDAFVVDAVPGRYIMSHN